TGEPGDLLLDPYDHGASVHEEDCRRMIQLTTGGTVPYDPSMIRSLGKRDMIARLLFNLKVACLKANDDAGALAAVERLLLLHPNCSTPPQRGHSTWAAAPSPAVGIQRSILVLQPGV